MTTVTIQITVRATSRNERKNEEDVLRDIDDFIAINNAERCTVNNTVITLSRKINIGTFVKTYGVACGGNWSQMLTEAIKNGLPEVYAKLDDNKEYEFSELVEILKENGIDCE